MFKILDTETLLNVAPDLADRRDILQDFISETRSDVGELERALEADDFPESVRLAHSIKGACSMVGAQELAQTCATIERVGRQCVPQAANGDYNLGTITLSSDTPGSPDVRITVTRHIGPLLFLPILMH